MLLSKDATMTPLFAQLAADATPSVENIFYWAEIHREMRAGKRVQVASEDRCVDFGMTQYGLDIELAPRVGETQMLRIKHDTFSRRLTLRLIFMPLMLKQEAFKVLRAKMSDACTGTELLQKVVVEASKSNEEAIRFLADLPFVEITGDNIVEVQLVSKKGTPQHSLDILSRENCAMVLVKMPVPEAAMA